MNHQKFVNKNESFFVRYKFKIFTNCDKNIWDETKSIVNM